MRDLIYQKFILGTGENLDYALNNNVGGVIFFTKDIQNENQFKGLIKDIKSKSKIKPFLAIDQEGGRVERTENIREKRLSPKYAFLKGEEYLKIQSNEISKELFEWGINLNFAPCVDVNTNPNNPIIGERAFSDNPDDVIKGAEIFINASRQSGITPCIKHFPGHGDADKDSHLTLPVLEMSLEELEKNHIKPFKELIKNGIEMVMVAHLHCKCFDKEIIPTSLSKNVIGYLRNKLNYNGVVITDDMVMNGVKIYNPTEACLMAINAGVDMFIYREANNETIEIIENLIKIIEQDKDLQDKIVKSNERIRKLKNSIKLK